MVDIASHAHGPAGALLVSVLDSSLQHPNADTPPECLATACRLAWLAFATETTSSCFSLARAAITELTRAGGDDQLLARAEVGADWRLEQDDEWPSTDRLLHEPDPKGWRAGLPAAAAAIKRDLATPSWGEAAAEQAGAALSVLQALFFSYGLPRLPARPAPAAP